MAAPFQRLRQGPPDRKGPLPIQWLTPVPPTPRKEEQRPGGGEQFCLIWLGDCITVSMYLCSAVPGLGTLDAVVVLGFASNRHEPVK